MFDYLIKGTLYQQTEINPTDEMTRGVYSEIVPAQNLHVFGFILSVRNIPLSGLCK